jgi:hypothetical protein
MGGRSSTEEISLLTPIPPAGRGNGTPRAGEERDSDKRTRGVADPPSDLIGFEIGEPRRRKNIAAGPIPPEAGEERDSGERTMGVDHFDLNEIG